MTEIHGSIGGLKPLKSDQIRAKKKKMLADTLEIEGQVECIALWDAVSHALCPFVY